VTAGWVSLLPPVLAIGLALLTRQVHLSLFAGIYAGTWALAGGPLAGLRLALEAPITVLTDPGNARVVVFSALVGALIALTQFSGGVAGFVAWLTRRAGIHTPRRARLLSFGVGVVVFVESSMTSLVNGAVCRPLFDRLKVSREQLAYLCDATAAPICILIPLNAWGAYLIGVLNNEKVGDPVGLLISAMPYNLYAWLAVLLALFVAITGWAPGRMGRAERRVRETGALLPEGATPVVDAEVTELEPAAGSPLNPLHFVVPVVALVALMPIGLYITGDGDLTRGSGSTSVLWAVLGATALAAVLPRLAGVADGPALTRVFFKGFGGLMPLALLMVLAFALGDVTRALGTGRFVASLTEAALPAFAVPAVIFLLGSGMAFATGTSWGTFAIMVPIALGVAGGPGAAHDAHTALLLGAALGGGIFGDHCSPISDTTLIASMAAGTDHLEHVRTQMPHALLAGGAALVLHLVLGLALT
jgi:tetracycline resistance efflux pump